MTTTSLPPALPSASELNQASPLERLKTLKAYLADAEKMLEEEHQGGQSGLANAAARVAVIDQLMKRLFAMADEKHPKSKVALVANGGYGRGYLNPGSDLDILFLLPKAAPKLNRNEKDFIDAVLYPLWDLGFKVGQACRSVRECISEGENDSHTRTTLFDSRFIAGDGALFQTFRQRFRKEVIEKRLTAFLADRRADLIERYQNYSDTVFLQEPNVKESPGALRDYHNLLWISDALYKTRDLDDLRKRGILSQNASEEMIEGFEFLIRVRNDLHYREGPNADVLTLRRQGPVSDFLGYTSRNQLKRIEALMRDYYRHARRIRQHTETIFEIAELEAKIHPKNIFGKPSASKPDRTFDHFYAQEGRLFAKSPTVFLEDASNLLSLFRLCQKFDLTPSPDLRKLIKAHRHLIDHPFRLAKTNRATFRTILQQKGKVGTTLRLMHRVGVLGLFLPEFGKMEFLVQHEFFHRYTADEHTLRCVDQLDALIDSDDPAHVLYRDIFINHQDPYALYLAILMHDSGRAMGVEEHIDGSAILTDRVCRRMVIKGERRKLIIFLVDQHLALFTTATRKDLSDPEVIADFAAQMKTKHNLDTLLLFTFADANGTNEEAWSSWKETLMLQLYRATRSFLIQGEAEYDAAARRELVEMREKVAKRLAARYAHLIEGHFEQMPKRYFRFRNARSIRHHLRAIGQYWDRRERRPDTHFECAVRWLEHPKDGYTELIVVGENQPGLLRRIACALAAHRISILSADVYTREDGLVLDLFRVTTEDDEAVADKIHQLSFVTTLYEISGPGGYDPSKYLEKPKNYLEEGPITEFSVPTRALVRNDIDPVYTVLEVQAVDRLALLHDILFCLEKHQFAITHARICTEKGVALDAFYILTEKGTPLSEEAALALEQELDPILRKS
ncbi:[protein-PII] uridylyltransferase [Roseibacillus ishigakijimensis]|uniref:Bifunctional uridylyltransferase/uridylyl-removing enzyme n=1 Tax=Roseibacillus ishigakijimensis TaxID=454146 RepID=A0A934VLW1_9BACT|nr:[protein-PII] uridylyltransferase [Roseibacillus ishigakijimensis]MBK1835099.1 [protein-PII] uridylyltransferase [Roseibacillus ishigakijimensis]